MGEPEQLHTSCKVCMVGGDVGTPEDCHDPCTPEEEEEDYQVAYGRMVRALDNGNVQDILGLAPQLQRHAVVNWERQSVQLLDCRGVSTIGDAPLTVEQLGLVEVLLQSADGMPIAHLQDQN